MAQKYRRYIRLMKKEHCTLLHARGSVMKINKYFTPNAVGFSSLSSFTTGTLTLSRPFDISSDIINYVFTFE